jgi:hypothetical protein
MHTLKHELERGCTSLQAPSLVHSVDTYLLYARRYMASGHPERGGMKDFLTVSRTFGETIPYVSRDNSQDLLCTHMDITNHHDPCSTTDNSLHESPYTAQTKRKNGETTFHHFSIAQTDKFESLNKVGVQQQQSFIGLLHSSASMGRFLIISATTIVFAFWFLTSQCDHLSDHLAMWWISYSLL